MEAHSGTHQNTERDHGLVYLLVADRTEEFIVALSHAAKLARRNNAKILLLYVMDEAEFQHWGDVQDMMAREYRQEAETILRESCEKIFQTTGHVPCVYIMEGGRLETIIDVINKDQSISRLILGGGLQSSGPGPLVSYFSGKGLSSLRVPLTIVPGNMDV